jgi:hypothetical protein
LHYMIIKVIHLNIRMENRSMIIDGKPLY